MNFSHLKFGLKTEYNHDFLTSEGLRYLHFSTLHIPSGIETNGYCLNLFRSIYDWKYYKRWI